MPRFGLDHRYPAALVAGILAGVPACATPAPVSAERATADAPPASVAPVTAAAPAQQTKKVLDLATVIANPSAYPWFEFRPNLRKLILAGAADTEHIALLWYTIEDGHVGLHRHPKTESVYVIDGTQSDAKGVYPTGTVYFNPPGSGHEISHSTGFFILAYAAPPDFQHTDALAEYRPVRIDTRTADTPGAYPFVTQAPGVKTYRVPLDAAGGMQAELIALQTPTHPHRFDANYVLVLRGNCRIDGATIREQTLVVTRTIASQPYEISSLAQGSCLAMSVAFAPPKP